MRTVLQGLAVAYCHLKQLRPFIIMAEGRLEVEEEEAEAKLESSALMVSDHKMK